MTDRLVTRPVRHLAGFRPLPLGPVTRSAANLPPVVGPLLTTVLAMVDTLVMMLPADVGSLLMAILAMIDTLVVALLADVGPLLMAILAMIDTVVVALLADVGPLLMAILAMIDPLVVALLTSVKLLLALFPVGVEPLVAILLALVMTGLVLLGLLLTDGLPGILPSLALVGPQLPGLLAVLVDPLGTIAAVGELLIQTLSGPLVHPALESRDPLGVPGAETRGELVDLGQTVRVVSLCGDLAEAAQFRDAVTILALREPGLPVLGPGRRFNDPGRMLGLLGADGRRQGTQGQRDDSNPAKTNDVHVPAPPKGQVARRSNV